MNLKEILAPAFKKMGMNEEQVAALFNADGTELSNNASDTITQHDATRVKSFKDEGTKLFNDGHKKGLAEGATKIEKEIKEKFGVNSDKLGVELVEDLVQASISKVTKAGEGDLTEDKVKLHPAYVKMQDEFSKQIKAKEKEAQELLNNYKQEVEKKSLFNEVVQNAKSKVQALKPILPKDPQKAERQMQLLINELAKAEFAKTEDGKDYIISLQGKPLEDGHGNRVNWETHVKQIAESIWDFENGEKRTTPGNTTAAGGAGNTTKYNGPVPKTQKEWMDAVSKPGITGEERIAITTAFKEAQSAG
jgi:hypothetical protein